MSRPPELPKLRTRLTLLNAGLAFACSIVVLVVVDLGLFSGNNASSNLSEVLRYSAAALVVLAAASITLGWLIAGRALLPLHAISRSMSADDLDSRVNVPAGYQEFTELADTLDAMRQRLHDSFTAQRQFIANASHELRTPLTVQRTLLQLTLTDPDATIETIRSACQELLDLGRQQEQLIEALLTLANGSQHIECRQPFDLGALTKTVASDHQSEAARHGIELRTDLTPAEVTGDPSLTTALLTNLITNAIRHNLPHGTVDITTTSTGRLTITNTGPPIPTTELPRLTQPFQRLNPDRTTQTEGHGLGLAIVTAIARAHQAPLTITPNPTGGLHITIDFPREDAAGSQARALQ
ncbi:HAMP domain-containing sensor histidine kinase [Kribbella sp. NPDC000426]|uniref:HAMP domain-containing sensor histidine kinase n=1 Tax=Kribbella sp. NPDC000426 TaxID=3154255 RepID=UPI0033316AAF